MRKLLAAALAAAVLLLVAAIPAPRDTISAPIQRIVDGGFGFTVGGPTWNGKTVQVELPVEKHLKNVGGSDGLGLCVFTSIDHAAEYQSVPALVGFRDWMRTRPGGGYPQKVAALIPQIASSRGLPTPRYVQHTGGDAEFLELALRTGRYVSVTYDGRDGVYYRNQIAHMVNLVFLDAEYAAIHDNNYPGQWLWMSREQFLSRWRGNSGGWAVVLLDPGPPPFAKRGTMRPIQCPGGICPPQGRYFPQVVYPNLMPSTPSITPTPTPSPVPDSVVKWYTRPNQPGLFLYRGETALGRLDTQTGVYTNMQGDIDVPAIEILAGEKLNYGVDTSRIPQAQSYEVNGVAVDRAKAFEAFGDGLVDDSSHRFLTLVADDATRKQFKNDCQNDPKLKALLKDIKVNSYDPGHWVVRSRNIPTGLTLQNANGEIVRTVGYSKPDDAVQLIEGRFPLIPPLLPSIPSGSWLTGLLLILVLFRDSLLGLLSRAWGAIGGVFKRDELTPEKLEALLAAMEKAKQKNQD